MEDKINKHYENISTGMKKGKRENAEDVTQYGEFISSYFAWVPCEKQKKIVKHLENATEKPKKQKRV